jgi:polysaccharide export outer membrane protein
MLNKVLWKSITHSIIGIALLTTANSVLPAICLAQQKALPPDSKISIKYILGNGDSIQVKVLDLPDYTATYQIPPNGMISLPLIGGVKVAGLTTDQANNLITKKYARYLKRPLVSVNLLAFRPINVFVAGEVTRPGAYTLNLQGGGGSSSVQYPTVLAALASAQGITLSADVSKIELHRKIGNSEQVIGLDLQQFAETGKISHDISLRDGDIIVVPTATKFDMANSYDLSSANFAASSTTPRTVEITGEVVRPGTYLVTSSTSSGAAGAATGGSVSGLPSLTRAIQLAGGITAKADIRDIKLHRPTRTGTEQTIDINLWQFIKHGDINQDVLLQDGDTIVIPKSNEVNPAEATELASTTLAPEVITVGVVGEVKKPGPTPMKPNSALNQAILAAGGFNDSRAKTANVDLIRLNPDGSVTKRSLKVDFAQAINEQTNPILQTNDVVIVSRSGPAQVSDKVNIFSNPLNTIFNILNFFGI